MASDRRVGVYLRVSTVEQSLDSQRTQVIAYVARRGWGQYQTFEDHDSGTKVSRPALQALLLEARQGRVSTIVCWKLDRLFRSMRHLVTTLNELNELGVEFVSVSDHIDLTTSSGRLMVHILGAFAEFEAALIRERVYAGLAAARKRGQRLGRPPIPPHPGIAELRAAGRSVREIARSLAVSPSSVQRALAGSKWGAKGAPSFPTIPGHGVGALADPETLGFEPGQLPVAKPGSV